MQIHLHHPAPASQPKTRARLPETRRPAKLVGWKQNSERDIGVMHWKIFCVLNLLVKFMFDVCRMVGGTVVSSWEDIVLAPRAPSMFQAKRGATQASYAKNCRIHHVQRIHVTMSRHTQQQMRKIERDQGHGVKIEKNEPADFLFRLKSASLNLNF